MAGAYPDVPAPRMAYDRDGTYCGRTDTAFGSPPTEMSNAQKTTLNDESVLTHIDQGLGGDVGYVFVFPEPRDIKGFVTQVTGTSGDTNLSWSGAWSTNTTNGIDGTWTALTGTTRSPHGDAAQRSGIIALNGPAAKGFRFQVTMVSGSNNAFLQTIHLYGAPSAGQAPNRLRGWHPTLDEEIGGAYFDWGDVPRSSTIYRDFRIKNPSATLTAQNVTLTREALTDVSPSNVSQHMFSTDGGSTWFNSVNIGDLDPGEISSIITLRRDSVSNAVLSVHALRLVATASAWV